MRKRSLTLKSYNPKNALIYRLPHKKTQPIDETSQDKCL